MVKAKTIGAYGYSVLQTITRFPLCLATEVNMHVNEVCTLDLVAILVCCIPGHHQQELLPFTLQITR